MFVLLIAILLQFFLLNSSHTSELNCSEFEQNENRISVQFTLPSPGVGVILRKVGLLRNATHRLVSNAEFSRPINTIWNIDPRNSSWELDWSRTYKNFPNSLNYADEKSSYTTYEQNLIGIFHQVNHDFQIIFHAVENPCEAVAVKGSITSDSTFDINVVPLSPEEIEKVININHRNLPGPESPEITGCPVRMKIKLDKAKNLIHAKCFVPETLEQWDVYGVSIISVRPKRARVYTNGVVIDNIFRDVPKMNRNCITFLSRIEDCQNCTAFRADNFVAPTFVHCQLGSDRFVHRFFYSMHPLSESGLPEVYNNWDDMDYQRMIRMEVENKHVYFMGKITVTCYFSRVLFANFGVMLMELKNGTLIYVLLDDSDGVGDDDRYYSRTVEQTIQIDNLDIHKVYCVGPVWNTTEFVNISHPIFVNPGVQPKFVTADKNVNEETVFVKINPGQEAVTISCLAVGDPIPQLKWAWNSTSSREQPFSEHFNRAKNVSNSTIVFDRIFPELGGDYTCKAKNIAGTKYKKFVVRFIQPPNLQRILLVLCASVILAILVSCSGYLIYKNMGQRKRMKYEETEIIREFIAGITHTDDNGDDYALLKNQHLFSLPYSDRFEVPLHAWNIDFSRKLGEGEYGVVYYGTVIKNKELTPVAVKGVKRHAPLLHLQALLAELKIISALPHHKNIVNIVAASTNKLKQRKVYIGLELCGFDSVLHFLKKNQDIGRLNLLQWSLGIARGMEFLSTQNVIHGDLAARNVLLTEASNHEIIPKISDFGLARHLGNYRIYKKKTKCPLPWKWLSIEALKESIFSIQSDMWSLGIVFWEIYSLGKSPYQDMKPGEFLHKLDSGFRMPIPSAFTPDTLYEIMLETWRVNPETRPSAANIVARLEMVYNSNNVMI